MKTKNSSLIFLLIFFSIIFIQNATAQNVALDSAKIYYKSERGPYWTKAQLDSFLHSKNNNRYKLVARKIKSEKRNDTLIYYVNLRMDPVALDNNNKPWKGQRIPSFNFKDIKGNTINSKELIGKPLVVNLWFTTCIPCIEEMPDLNRLKKIYQDSGVAFIAITFDSKISVLNFLKKHDLDFTIIPGAKSYCDHITGLYPLTFFVDRKGIIRFAEHVLPFSFDTLNSEFHSMLENQL
jgi:peroxiredoxin